VRKGNYKYHGKTENGFFKFLRPEDILQHEFIKYCGLAYPWLKYHHSPDAGRRTKFEQFLYKYLGSDSGFLDLLFPELLLIIELKVKPNRVTESQQIWIDYFKKIGWMAEVCWTFDEAREVLDFRVQSKMGEINSRKAAMI